MTAVRTLSYALALAGACLVVVPHVAAQQSSPPAPVIPPSDVMAPTTAEADPRTRPPDPVVRPNATPVPPRPPEREPQPELASLCTNALRAAGVAFEAVGTHPGEGVCGIDEAVRVQSIGDVALSPSALLACPTALAFTQFLATTLTPEAAQAFGSRPQTVHVAASYVCRTRNHQPGARVSEHGFGRAIDVRAITLQDGQSWSVQPQDADASTPNARFQRAVRQAACGPFKTVLGPGSDGFHQDHIHFDNAPRSSTYCR